MYVIAGPTMAVIAYKCPHITVVVVDINQVGDSPKRSNLSTSGDKSIVFTSNRRMVNFFGVSKVCCKGILVIYHRGSSLPMIGKPRLF